MKFRRLYSTPDEPYAGLVFEARSSRIVNPDGSVIFEAKDVMVPTGWSQVAVDVLAQKYCRKAGVPTKTVRVEEADAPRWLWRSEPAPDSTFGPERDSREVFNRLAGCWTYWGWKNGYFDTEDDALVYHDEMCSMLARQIGAPNSPQWFNTGLHWAYGISGPSQGHYFVDPRSEEVLRSANAFEHPQVSACLPHHALVSTPDGPIPIGDIVDAQMIGQLVYDNDGITRVVAAVPNGIKDVVRVNLSNGNYIEATSDHRVLVRTDTTSAVKWKQIDELQSADRLIEKTMTAILKRSESFEDSAEASLSGRHEPTRVEAGSIAVLPRSVEIARRRYYGFVSEEKSAKMLAGFLPPEEQARKERLLTVESVVSLGSMPVYDIQTESGSFLTRNVVVHNCFILSIEDDLVNEGGIFDGLVREARIFKGGSGSGANFSKIRSAGEKLTGGGTSSGLMSFLKVFDRAAGAIKSGGTTRRAAKMVVLNADHPDIEEFVNWKVKEERKVADLVIGSRMLEAQMNAIMTAAHDTRIPEHARLDIALNPHLRKALRDATRAGVPTGSTQQALDYAKQGYTR
ncbi:MAG: hypothetical protein ABI282_05420, partial [Candidatus Baltobacteraceae bacterium]